MVGRRDAVWAVGLLLCAAVGAQGQLVTGQASCPADSTPYESHCYKTLIDPVADNSVPAQLDFKAAQAFCANEAAGGYIVSIENQAENDFIFGIIVNAYTPWLGASSDDHYLTWDSGEVILFSNWADAEPTNPTSGEFCATMDQTGDVFPNARWRTQDCTSTASVICEWPADANPPSPPLSPPPPSSPPQTSPRSPPSPPQPLLGTKTIIFSPSPLGALLDAATSITLLGMGLPVGREAELNCIFGEWTNGVINVSRPFVEVAVELITPTTVACAPATFSSAVYNVGSMIYSGVIDAGDSSNQRAAANDFAIEIYDLAAVLIDEFKPQGASRNRLLGGLEVGFFGSGFVNYGKIECSFGEWGKSSGALLEITPPDSNAGRLISCPVPEAAAEDARRVVNGETDVVVQPVGVTLDGINFVYPPATGNREFFVHAGLITGASSATALERREFSLAAPASFTFAGSGLVSYFSNSTKCSFASSTSVESGPGFVSDDGLSVTCQPAPSALEAQLLDSNYVSFDVSISIDGGHEYLPFALSQPRVSVYDIGFISISDISAQAGLDDGGTVVTISGSGISAQGPEFGGNSPCCTFTDSFVFRGCVAAATLVTTETEQASVWTAVCTLPAYDPSTPRDKTLALSFNNGVEESTVNAEMVAEVGNFRYVAAPTVSHIMPDTGNAEGGETVTIIGTGFADLELTPFNYAGVRIFFGQTEVQPIVNVTNNEVLSPTDMSIEVVTPVGSGATRVTVSLEGQLDVPTLPSAVFTFVGFHTPVLSRAAFDATGSTLVIRFDSQPTNRAGMVGVTACSAVLDSATIDLLTGGSAPAPQCYWPSDTVLVAQLLQTSILVPGSTVGIQANVVKPALFTGDCATSVYCLGAATAIISSVAPCEDANGTPAVAGCPKPVAYISAPPIISACASADLVLDGTVSVGGGAGQLTFKWTVNTAVSDRAAVLTAILADLSATTAVVRIPAAALDGGTFFEFFLRVTSSLGVASDQVRHNVTRTGLVPTLTLQGPKLRRTRAETASVLSVLPSVPSCLAATSSAAIELLWTLAAVRTTSDGAAASAPAIGLGSTVVANRQRLTLPPFSLRAGLTYEFALFARLTSGASTDTARTTVSLVVEPQPMRATLAAGDRTLPAASAWRVDASASTDPNLSPRSALTSASGDVTVPGLAFQWAITPANASALADDELASVNLAAAALAASALNLAVLRVPAGTLTAGSYRVAVTVASSAAIPTGGPSTAAAIVKLAEDALPTLTLEALTRGKVNTDWSVPADRFVLRGSLDALSSSLLVTSGGSAFDVRWTVEQALPALDESTLSRLVPLALDLSDTSTVTTTGRSGLSLAFRPNVLTPGAEYRFTLTVTPAGSGVSAVASVNVLMNRPPFGGSLSASVDASPLEFLSPVSLLANGWQDDDETDLPLLFEFRFSYSASSLLPALAESLGPKTFAPRVTVEMSAGDYAFFVIVIDQFNGQASTSTSATVPQPSITLSTPAAILQQVEAAERELDAGDVESAILIVRALAAGGPLVALANSTDPLHVAAIPAVVRELMLLLIRAAALGNAKDEEGDVALRRLLVGTVADLVRYSASNSNALLTRNELDGTTQARALGQLRDFAAAALLSGLDDASVESHRTAFESLLERNVTEISDAEDSSIGDAARAFADALSRALIADATGDEPESGFVGRQLSILSARLRAPSVGNLTVRTPEGLPFQRGSVILPVGILQGSGVNGDDLDSTVDVLLTLFSERQVISRMVNSRGALGELFSSIFSVELRAGPDGGGGKLSISGLPSPVELALPLPSGVSCTTDADCGGPDGRGKCACDPASAACVGIPFGECTCSTNADAPGVCMCGSPFSGANCSRTAQCAFYDEERSFWSSEGCTTIARPADGPFGFTICQCTHLTAFGGVRFPDSAEEFEDNIEKIRFNTFNSSDIGEVFSDPDIGNNPTLYAVVASVIFLDLAFMLVGFGIDTRERRLNALKRGTTYKLKSYDKATHDKIIEKLDQLNVRLRTAGRNREAELLVRTAILLQANARRMLAIRKVNRLRYGGDAVEMTAAQRKRMMARIRKAREAEARRARGLPALKAGPLEKLRSWLQPATLPMRSFSSSRHGSTSARLWRRGSDDVDQPSNGAPAAEGAPASGVREVLTKPVSVMARLLRRSRRALREQHPIAAVLIAKRPKLGRAQLAHCLASLLLLQLLVEAMLFDPDIVDIFDLGDRRRRLQQRRSSGDSSDGVTSRIGSSADPTAELIPFEFILVISLICAALTFPGLYIFRAIFRIGNKAMARHAAPQDMALELVHEATAAMATALGAPPAAKPKGFLEWTSEQLGITAPLTGGMSQTSSFKKASAPPSVAPSRSSSFKKKDDSSGAAGGSEGDSFKWAPNFGFGEPHKAAPPLRAPGPSPPPSPPPVSKLAGQRSAPSAASSRRAPLNSAGARPAVLVPSSVTFDLEAGGRAKAASQCSAASTSRSSSLTASRNVSLTGQPSRPPHALLERTLEYPPSMRRVSADMKSLSERRHDKRALTVVRGLISGNAQASRLDMARALSMFLEKQLAHYSADTAALIEAREIEALSASLNIVVSSAEENVLLHGLKVDRKGAMTRTVLVDFLHARLEAAQATEASLKASEPARRRVPPWAFGAVAWLVHGVIFAMMVVVLLTFGTTLGDEMVINLMQGWCMTILCSMGIQEPTLIAVLASMPIVFEMVLSNPAAAELVHSFFESWIGQIVSAISAFGASCANAC